jgi:amidase
MARSVSDAALLLSVMTGPDPRDPISISESGDQFRAPLDRSFRGVRLAFSPDLGSFPVEKAVTDTIEKALPVFRDLGCRLENAHPDFTDAAEIFQVLRAQDYAFSRKDDLDHRRELLKDTVIWNAEQGLKLSALDVSRAQARRAALYQRVREFLQRYEFLLLPVSQVAPFPVEVEWVREINGVKMQTYIDWMMSCSFITITELPALSIPCGFTGEGLPVGLQIVGRHRRDFEVLQLAFAFEQATQVARRRPEVAVQV